ncbi:integrase arm-type DNA-binding domain-containing protein [Massilia sp. TS11]|uniref:tyrosine-type recombinase/integrase n=1 Tax=Massilia sp. TS11 TaxID=2908003 RepID=UPI0027D9617E|nr:integrase arm-type DNA-binding domain-containing protein [Massilia sp. TS11]
MFATKVAEPGYHRDGDGLCLRVSRQGTKSWIFRFDFHHQRHEMGLGALRDVSLSQAREKAGECRAQLKEGRNPLDERRRAMMALLVDVAHAYTFDECAAQYIRSHRCGWRNPKHAAQWEATLATYVSPIFGKLLVARIDTAHVVTVLEPIWHTKTETAKRLRGRIEAILDWATVRQYRQGENPARWRGHLATLLPEPGRVRRTTNFAAMDWREVGGFMRLLRQREGMSARALEFAILTAARSGEVRGATWDEIDFAGRLWTVPAERMKAGREHRVPLSDAALRLLESLSRKDGLVFPGRRSDAALSDMSLTAVLRRMGHGDITVHGFRSAFRDWCAEDVSNAFSREVCEHALAHSLPDRVEAAYRRGDLLEKRRVLMQTWADFLASANSEST